MGIATQKDAHVRPGLTKGFHKSFENADNLFPGRTRTRTQEGRDQSSCLAFINVQGHVTAFIIIAIEQRQRLIAVNLVIGVIDIQNDRFGRPIVGRDEPVHKGLGNTI